MADTLKIDVFPHIMPERFSRRLGDIIPAFASRPNTTSRPSLWDLDERFRMMDQFPGYVQILTLSSPPVEEFADAATARDLVQLANDEMAELVARYPDRFLGFAASVSLLDVDTALVEAERAIHQLGALGVQIFTNVAGHPLDEPRFEPFFARLDALNRMLWVHPTRTADHPDYPSETTSKYGMFMKLGWPYETSVFMSRLIFSGIMDRYPNLRVLTHHAGGIVPHLAGRLVLHLDLPAERKSLGVPDAYTPERAIAAYGRFYGDTVFSGDHHPLACAIDFFGLDHILFGTDMPYGAEGGALFIRETIAAVEELNVSEGERRRLFEDNARTLLGLRA